MTLGGEVGRRSLLSRDRRAPFTLKPSYLLPFAIIHSTLTASLSINASVMFAFDFLMGHNNI